MPEEDHSTVSSDTEEHEESRLTGVVQHSLDPQAFEHLYYLYLPRLYAYVSSRVGHKQTTEDLVSDIFLKAVQGLPSFRPQHVNSFAAWLFRIAHNAVLNHHRDTGVTEQWEIQQAPEELYETYSGDPTPESIFLRREQAEALHRLLLRLPKRRQEIIQLRFFGELHNNEIAAVLDLDERTVASHLCRGLRDLHAAWLAETQPPATLSAEPRNKEKVQQEKGGHIPVQGKQVQQASQGQQAGLSQIGENDG